MPHVNPAGSSPPPVSGRVEDPQRISRTETAIHSRTSPADASDPGPPAQQVEVNHGPENRGTGDGDEETVCGQGRNREEVIKEISISSTAFIGPTCRPEPVIEDELSEFYKEIAQIDQPDAVDGSNERGSQLCAPSHAVDGNTERAQFCSRPVRPSVSKQRSHSHRNASRPYPAPWPYTDHRDTSQWGPESHDASCSWPNSHSYPNQWQFPPLPPPPLCRPPPPPRFHFYPPPRPESPMHQPFRPPQLQLCGSLGNNGFRFGPDVRLAQCHDPAPSAPYGGIERPQSEEQNYQDVNECEPSLVLIMMRGLPGSGKSTLARQVSSSDPSGLVLSTDDYFYQKDGYRFDPTLLGAAHDWNQNRAKKAMLDRRTPVVIDNTNLRAWEMKPYVSMALDTGYRVEFVEPETSWKCDPVELERRNHHGVPRETITSMLDRFELPVSVDIVMSSCEPSHKRKEHNHRPYRHRRR